MAATPDSPSVTLRQLPCIIAPFACPFPLWRQMGADAKGGLRENAHPLCSEGDGRIDYFAGTFAKRR